MLEDNNFPALNVAEVQEDFTQKAWEIFQRQSLENHVYRDFLGLLPGCKPNPQNLFSIPALPVSFFKQSLLATGTWNPEAIFTSSGTGGGSPSRHPVRSLKSYRENAARCFCAAYGPPENYAFAALLPHYLERSGSSLVDMAAAFIQRSRYPDHSGFFLDDFAGLHRLLEASKEKGIPQVLLGVSFALLRFSRDFPLPFPKLILMETGGMKGQEKEISREELHGLLKKAFGVEKVHSEYGMTELLSQAYSCGHGLFRESPSLRIFIRDMTNPFREMPFGKTGAVNLIDLANEDSLAFLATDDLGRKWPDGSFEILGRLDYSEMRGCNLLLENDY